ncbi:MAG: beta-1,6-N-acetylglucosaminyltransferase [bacterium]
MKKIAYIILTYKDSLLTERVIKKLKDDRAEFFIHVDKKTDISDFLFLENYPNVHLVKDRVLVKWGSISTTQAALSGFKEASKNPDIGFFLLLSGQDYPIKRPSEIFALAEQGKSLLNHFELPYSGWKGGGMHRFRRYHLFISRNGIIRRIDNIINFFLPRRKLPLNQKAYGGDFWCGLTRESVEYIFDFLKKNPDYLNFFKYTFIVDELFFPIVLLNGPASISKGLDNKFTSYADWSKPKGPYPATLTEKDFDNIKNKPNIFIRKIDRIKSEKLLDLIDNNLLS